MISTHKIGKTAVIDLPTDLNNKAETIKIQENISPRTKPITAISHVMLFKRCRDVTR